MPVTKYYHLPVVYSSAITQILHTDKYVVCKTRPYERNSNYPESAYFKQFRRVHIYVPKTYKRWKKLLKYGIGGLMKIEAVKNYSKPIKGVLCCYASAPVHISWHPDYREKAVERERKVFKDKEEERKEKALLDKLFKDEDPEYVEWLEEKTQEGYNY